MGWEPLKFACDPWANARPCSCILTIQTRSRSFDDRITFESDIVSTTRVGWFWTAREASVACGLHLHVGSRAAVCCGVKPREWIMGAASAISVFAEAQHGDFECVNPFGPTDPQIGCPCPSSPVVNLFSKVKDARHRCQATTIPTFSSATLNAESSFGSLFIREAQTR